MKKILILWVIFPCTTIYGFSVHDDILGRPRYQIKFKDIPISTQIANNRLLNNNTYNNHLEHDILKMNNDKYLCTTPKIQDELLDHEETPEVKAKKENETKKALDNGLKLISPLENNCIYYLEGWWMYVLCYNRYVKQFHSKDWDGSQKSLRTLENQSENYYLLGRFNSSINEGTSFFSKIEYNGDSYYISQKITGGNYCNLIQDNRHIEVQYMCEPDTYDKIAFITEISTCSYRMIVHTSRLCKEPFFNQIASKKAHVINCEKILSDNEYVKWMNSMFPKTINTRYIELFFSDPRIKHASMKKKNLKKTKKMTYNYQNIKKEVFIVKNTQGNKYSTKELEEENKVLFLNYPLEIKEHKNNKDNPEIKPEECDSLLFFLGKKSLKNTLMEKNINDSENLSKLKTEDNNQHNNLDKSNQESLEKLATICSSIQKCLQLRCKYMKLSLQRHIDNPRHQNTWKIFPEDGKNFNIEMFKIPGEDNQIKYTLGDSGIFQIYMSKNDMELNKPILKVPSVAEFCMDLKEIISLSVNGPIKTFSANRLQYLEEMWNLYSLYYGKEEIFKTRDIHHRDFYNVVKVDTHIHHDAATTQQKLVQFMKSKLENFPNDIVSFQDGKSLTLKDMFDSLNLSSHDLTVDLLNMHAYKDVFKRFDIFSSNFNPFGKREFRVVFLTVDNYMKGKYFAELTQKLIDELKTNKYQMAEYRLTNSGTSFHEWNKLAAWVVDNNLFSPNVRWLIQIPRIYNVFKKIGALNNMGEFIKNFFQPLFDVTQNPSRNPKLHIFLQRVVGFDSVDDESKPEKELEPGFPSPNDWDGTENPPYSYWIYYTYTNLAILNHWRKKRGFNTFVFRPHSGEAGNVNHLASSFLTSYSINHGILLESVPFIQYLYYLAQIGIAMSPISNNSLFLKFNENPFPAFFKRGLNISLSTDDPVQFHFTDNPLAEEYNMCEIARNSVLQSGFEYQIKLKWLGKDFEDEQKTNIPKIRLDYRKKMFFNELLMLANYINFNIKKSAAI
ncbi:hypothetical protein PCANB_000102 [Pneumocystis canis]|nr:hypothetical protein PCANB_000102 [Pneumocystis canis]